MPPSLSPSCCSQRRLPRLISTTCGPLCASLSSPKPLHHCLTPSHHSLLPARSVTSTLLLASAPPSEGFGFFGLSHHRQRPGALATALNARRSRRFDRPHRCACCTVVSTASRAPSSTRKEPCDWPLRVISLRTERPPSARRYDSTSLTGTMPSESARMMADGVPRKSSAHNMFANQ